MELPSIPEQIVEADRLCAEARRLIGELRELTAAARQRWDTIRLYNRDRWDTPVGSSGRRLRGRPKRSVRLP